MMNDTNIWLQQLSTLRKSQMRKAASGQGLQLVHLEILQYLWLCNKYSNTAQGLSEYLGQTKGSISQSLKFIENAGHIERKTCTKDARAIRICLTKKGKASYQRMLKDMPAEFEDDKAIITALKTLLIRWQAQNDMNSFGQCKSCRYNQNLNHAKFKCGLTGESLSKTDIQKICREHRFHQT